MFVTKIKRENVDEDGECHNISDNAFYFQILKKMYVCSSTDDELRNIRHQKARDRYANMSFFLLSIIFYM